VSEAVWNIEQKLSLLKKLYLYKNNIYYWIWLT